MTRRRAAAAPPARLPTLPPEVLERIAEALPQSDRWVLADCGHSCNLICLLLAAAGTQNLNVCRMQTTESATHFLLARRVALFSTCRALVQVELASTQLWRDLFVQAETEQHASLGTWLNRRRQLLGRVELDGRSCHDQH